MQSFEGRLKAAHCLEQYDRKPVSADVLLEGLRALAEPEQRATAQFLLLSSLRHRRRIDWELDRCLKRRPRAQTWCLLRLAVGEMLEAVDENETKWPLYVHHSVDVIRSVASKQQAGLANAVLRNVGRSILAGKARAEGGLAVHYAHPDWLVEKWRGQFGEEALEGLLAWNQKGPDLHLSLMPGLDESPPGLEETAWSGWWRFEGGALASLEPWLARGEAYIQDPFTVHPVELLAPKPGERVLDLCAAPGGKSFQILRSCRRAGGEPAELMASDLPGVRLERLRGNLERFGGAAARVQACDLLEEAGSLGRDWDAILIDVPCTNTGVLRRRPDARWRLEAGESVRMAELQGRLLEAAAGLLGAGGRLVYSTCSLESEENEGVIERFLASDKGGAFERVQERQSRPWIDAHDGGYACLLRLAEMAS